MIRVLLKMTKNKIHFDCLRYTQFIYKQYLIKNRSSINSYSQQEIWPHNVQLSNVLF